MFLQDLIAESRAELPVTVKISLTDGNSEVYSCYRGGKAWSPKIPAAIAKEGEDFAARISIPSVSDFLDRLSSITLANEIGIRWMSNSIKLSNFNLSDDEFSFEASQDPPISGVGHFLIRGFSSGRLGFDRGRAFLEFKINDAIGGSRSFRICHNGHSFPTLGVQIGRVFCPVFLVSHDGVRLRIAYRDCRFSPHVATIYLQDPTSLYELGRVDDYECLDRSGGLFRVVRISDVKLIRTNENTMLRFGTTYDVGRIGAEIAYAVARRYLRIDDAILIEPSQPGVDLYSRSGKTVIQARLLVEPHYVPGSRMGEIIRAQLADMLRSLQRDLRRFQNAEQGYAILSLTDAKWTTSTLVVPAGGLVEFRRMPDLFPDTSGCRGKCLKTTDEQHQVVGP